MMHVPHIPVLEKELDDLLQIRPGDIAIDATLDGGSHTRMILERIYPNGTLLGIEQDSAMIMVFKERMREESENDSKNTALWNQLIIANGNFRDLARIAATHHIAHANIILFDLGVSRWHFKESGRGFSFEHPEEPLSMALGEHNQSAAEILNNFKEVELADLIWRYGEERKSRMIARRIIDARKKKKFTTVADLLALFPRAHSKRHPATKLFQALRIGVNDELQALSEGLSAAWNLLLPGNKCAVISYHSLEDRIVKRFFKDQHGVLLTKKPIVASYLETKRNPSARSAKLRIIEKII